MEQKKRIDLCLLGYRAAIDDEGGWWWGTPWNGSGDCVDGTVEVGWVSADWER